MSSKSKNVDQLAVNTIRFLAVDGVQKANSGHPGMPMGCAPIAYSLYAKIMKHNPKNPKWLNRDRFVLSAGHGSMLLYSVLHLSGYKVTLNDLKNFRQWGSITPGHPEFGLTEGVETTTGPLGQGIANAVGMAIAQAHLAARFNKPNFKIIDHYIYGICGDGDLMEGISHEAASIAGHLKLGKLIFFYDNNGITIDGSTSLAFSEDIEKRFSAYGWQVLKINDGNDLKKINQAVKQAQKMKDKPTLIITNTHIGYGSPHKQDTASVHGSPLGVEEIKLTKKNLNWPENKSFYIPPQVKKLFSSVPKKGKDYEMKWNKLFTSYKKKYPAEAKLLLEMFNGNYDEGWKKNIPSFKDEGKLIATRKSSGSVLNALAKHIPSLIGGSADLHPSTNTYLDGYGSFSASNYSARNIHYGIREHAMGSILNGIAYYGGLIPFGATFLVFSDYLRPVLRLACLSKIKSIFVFTHDSIGLGEDGPTHQPVEHLSSLRTIPGLVVIRPADANESAYAWQAAIEHKKSPVAIILTRQGLPVLNQKKYPSAKGLLKGAYILKDSFATPDVILMASGSEVAPALQAADKLEKKKINVRVVSFPSWELFEKQSAKYKNKVLPKSVKLKVSIEAGVKQGWEKYVGDNGYCISIEKFGASAPDKVLLEKYGLTAENIVKTVMKLYKNK